MQVGCMKCPSWTGKQCGHRVLYGPGACWRRDGRPERKAGLSGELLRHLLAWWGGQGTDPESGHPHLWHVMTNAVFLVSYSERKIGEDDRP